ncbi:MAG: fused MFS/spermidine synthase, partial [candidate division KSB1 bacterium]|nr:fused MFS/spermidine synthase [candidate division KSB1 bacterium]
LAGFVLIRSLGQTWTMTLAAGLNLFTGAAAFLLDLKAKRLKPTGERLTDLRGTPVQVLPERVVRFVLIAFGIEGFTALAYEVIYTRILLGFSYDKSLYFYPTVIFTFIFGLSLGSFIISKFIDRHKNLLMLFAGLEIAIGSLAILVLHGFARLAEFLAKWRLDYGEDWWRYLGKEYLLFFLVMVLPAVLMGMTFPVVSRLCTDNLKRLGSRLGVLGFLDTVGSIFGSFAAGFILIPLLGVVYSVVAAAAINLVIGLLSILLNPLLTQRSRRIWTLAAAGLFVLLALIVPDSRYFRYWQTRRPGDRLLFYKEGADAAIAVPQHSDGVRFLAINGSVTAFAEYGDIRVHKMLGCLPALLHEQPRNALVIGLGMGVTAKSLVAQGIERIDCVEINPGVVQACAGYFKDLNGNVLDLPNVHVIKDDGRSYLQMTSKKYDLITSNAVHARLSGNLYTKEFYEICRNRLNSNGIMCQWTSTNWLSPIEFKSLITAFSAVFPHTSLWLVNPGHLLLIGTQEPLRIPYERLESRLAQPDVQADLYIYALGNAPQLLAHYVMDETSFPVFLKNIPMNTDDRPIAELSRVVNKTQIPEILLEFIKIKASPSGKLVFSTLESNEQQEVITKVNRYAEAEKYYLESTFARNFYRESLLALHMVTEALRIEPEDYRYREEAASLNLLIAQELVSPESERLKLLDNAVEHLEIMIRLAPDFAYDWTNLGFVLMNRNRLDDAERAFRRAIELDPEVPLPRNYLAAILGGTGRLSEAEQILKPVLTLFPDELETYYRLGLIYELQKKPTSAAECYAEIVKRDSHYRDAADRLRKIQQRKK